jgi:hypothetical protein
MSLGTSIPSSGPNSPATRRRGPRAHAAALLTAIDADWLCAVLGGEDPALEKWKEQPIEKRLLALKILLEVMQRLPPCTARDIAPGRSWAFRSHCAPAAFPSIKSVRVVRSARTSDG